MGVIQRQGFKHSIVQYIGIAVGAMTQLYLVPKVLDAYGLAMGLIATALFMSPLISFGSHTLGVRFFPKFKNQENGHNGFLWILIGVAGLGCLIFFLGFPFLEGLISKHLLKPDKSPWNVQFLPYVLPLTIILVYNRLLAMYASNFQRIVVPSILEDFLIKITLPLLLILFLSENIPIEWVVYGILGNYIIVTVGLISYLIFLGQFRGKLNLSFISKKLRNEMLSYARYGVINSMGAQAAFRVDTLMVVGKTNLSSTAIFSQANFFSEALSKPRKSIVGIAQPIIAKAIAEDNLTEVKKIYKKSSLTLLIFGLFLFTGLWTCLDDLFTIMNKPEMEAGRWAIFFLCLARLLNMSTGVNNEIINYSKYYRFNFYMYLVLAVINISMNIWLIEIYGLVGAAIATFCSFILFEITKITFVKWRFGFQPYTHKTLIVIGLALACYLPTLFFPDLGNPYLNIIIKGGFIGLTYPIAVLKLNLSEDFSQMFRAGVEKFAPFLKRFLS